MYYTSGLYIEGRLGGNCPPPSKVKRFPLSSWKIFLQKINAEIAFHSFKTCHSPQTYKLCTAQYIRVFHSFITCHSHHTYKLCTAQYIRAFHSFITCHSHHTYKLSTTQYIRAFHSFLTCHSPQTYKLCIYSPVY